MTNDGADAVSGTGAELLARFRLGPSPSHGGGRGWQAAISCPAARAPVPPGPPSGPAAGPGHRGRLARSQPGDTWPDRWLPATPKVKRTGGSWSPAGGRAGAPPALPGSLPPHIGGDRAPHRDG